MDDYLRSLLDRDGVRFETTALELDADEFAETRARSRKIDGGVAVAIVGDAGVVLVRNEWMDGYGFPGGGVEPGEGWETAAVREAEEETGIAVELGRPWLVQRQFYEHGDRRCGGGHTVFFTASPRGEGDLADDPGVDDEVIEDLGWFESVPDRCVRPALVETVLTGGIRSKGGD